MMRKSKCIVSSEAHAILRHERSIERGKMVEVLECSVIRVSSVLNEWMDCVFVLRKDDEEKAVEVLKKAWDDFWKDDEGWCYGDYLEERLASANIEFDSYYANDALE